MGLKTTTVVTESAVIGGTSKRCSRLHTRLTSRPATAALSLPGSQTSPSGAVKRRGRGGGERWPVFVYVTPTVSYLPSYTLAYKPLSPFNIPSFVQSVPDATPSCDCGQAVFIFLVLGRPPQRCCPEAAHGWRCRASGGRQATTPQPRFGDGVRAVLESVLSDSCYWFDRYPPPSSQSKTTGVDESSHGTIITFSELREEKVEWNFGSEVGSDYNPDDDFVEISYTDSDAVSSSAN